MRLTLRMNIFLIFLIVFEIWQYITVRCTLIYSFKITFLQIFRDAAAQNQFKTFIKLSKYQLFTEFF